MTQTATSPQRRPLLDEPSFQQLLSAAYVLQEHNDRLRAKGFQADFAENLSAIVETQKLIQTLQLDLAAAAELVAERVQKITSASGTAIGIIEKGQLFYRSATGSAAVEAGTRVEPGSALSADCLAKGSALNYPDVTSSLHVHSENFRRRGVKSFIAVPVYHAGRVAGVLELRFARANSFREADLRTAELMAGLLSEAMVTASRMKWKEALASERQSMLEALERIKPQIERLGIESTPLEDAAASRPAALAPPAAAPVPVRTVDTCPACGTDFFDESESFCGTCGNARPPAFPAEVAAPAIQKDAALEKSTDHRINDRQINDRPSSDNRINDRPWLIPYGVENPSNGNSAVEVPRAEGSIVKENAAPASASAVTLPSVEKPEVRPSPAAGSSVILPPAAPAVDSVLRPAPVTAAPAAASPAPLARLDMPVYESSAESLRIVPADGVPANELPSAPLPEELAVAAGAATDELQPYPWSSAKKAQHWLEGVKTSRGARAEWLAQQWQRRRANIYLVLAGVILLLVISGWGIRPAGTATAGNAVPSTSSQPQTPPQPELTLFEKLMVSLGLAEAPPAPVDLGNPDAQVWVDVHTALYYCSGSELYGKTADGKFSTQRDAEQDQFEPANRKACP